MTEIILNIWQVMLDASFWLLLGLLAAGLVKAYVPESAMQRWMGGSGFTAVTRAALFGAPLPLCSCGVLPAALGMYRSGASKEATVSFLISTPETSTDSVAVTYALMGPLMAVYRPIAALFSAMVSGMMVTLVKDEEPPQAPEAVSSCGQSSCASGCSSEAPAVEKTENRLMAALRYGATELLDDISRWLMLGIILAGVMNTLIPPGWLAQWGQGLAAMLIMLLVGIPMYICASASTPVAAGLLIAGVSPGTVLVFLLVGPATNMASIMLLSKTLGRQVTAMYLLGLSLCSIASGLLLDWLIELYQYDMLVSMEKTEQLLPAGLQTASALLLLILIWPKLRSILLPFLKAPAQV